MSSALLQGFGSLQLVDAPLPKVSLACLAIWPRSTLPVQWRSSSVVTCRAKIGPDIGRKTRTLQTGHFVPLALPPRCSPPLREREEERHGLRGYLYQEGR